MGFWDIGLQDFWCLSIKFELNGILFVALQALRNDICKLSSSSYFSFSPDKEKHLSVKSFH